MIDFARGRGWFAGEVDRRPGGRAARGGRGGRQHRGADPRDSPVGPLFIEATQVLERALGIFERLGDRTGVMSTVIAMAYAQYGPVMHLSRPRRGISRRSGA